MKFNNVCRRIIAFCMTLPMWLGAALIASHAQTAFAQPSFTILHVDGENGLATPIAPPGDTWNNAFKYLQDALTHAASLNPTQQDQIQIWVRKGTYKPDEDADNPSGDDDTGRYFQLRNFVQLYGGFKGTETELSERRVRSHPTILSGDLSGDDVALPPGPFHKLQRQQRPHRLRVEYQPHSAP